MNWLVWAVLGMLIAIAIAGVLTLMVASLDPDPEALLALHPAVA
jgi:hypothetical protein